MKLIAVLLAFIFDVGLIAYFLHWRPRWLKLTTPACQRRLLLWRLRILFKPVLLLLPSFLSDNHPGGFLLFYWMLFIGDKWILDSIQDSLEVSCSLFSNSTFQDDVQIPPTCFDIMLQYKPVALKFCSWIVTSCCEVAFQFCSSIA